MPEYTQTGFRVAAARKARRTRVCWWRVSRQTLIALADPAKITTLVVWTTNDIYEAWRASPQRTMAMSGADRLWAKPPESERFQLVG